MKLPTPLIDHDSGRVYKGLSALTVRANNLLNPDYWIDCDDHQPLGYSLVKETVGQLQLDHLFLAELELCDENKALEHRECNGKLFSSDILLFFFSLFPITITIKF